MSVVFEEKISLHVIGYVQFLWNEKRSLYCVLRDIKNLRTVGYHIDKETEDYYKDKYQEANTKLHLTIETILEECATEYLNSDKHVLVVDSHNSIIQIHEKEEYIKNNPQAEMFNDIPCECEKCKACNIIIKKEGEDNYDM